VILPFIFQKPRNKKKIEMAVAEQLPDVMAYLEKLAPGEGFLCGEMSMGDIAVAVHFSNLRWARIEVEKDRWPKTCAWVDRTQATPALAKVTRLGEMLVQTPPGGHHAALANLGVPLTETTLATDTPRRGPMSVE
jgi:glutathione S-transferase